MESALENMQGISDGVKYLANGYLEYAEEVITDRALPNIYDGLKPVNRRVMVILSEAKTKGFIKCATTDGATLQLHPHGNTSVYAAMVLMTDRNGSLAFPLLAGSGNFGDVRTDDKAAADRYTEAKLHPSAVKEYFGEMESVKQIPNYDYTRTEPEVLPVSFPAILVNSTSGIAVGFRSNIPSFNFVDVCNLVKEYIKNGECTTVIEPDFVTGGYYVRNNKELAKLMRAGTGRLKLRGKYIVTDKRIDVTDVPYGKTNHRLIKQVNELDSNSIRNAYDTFDFSSGTLFSVDCSSKNKVNEVVYRMYKNTDFQYTYSADITVIKDGSPIRIGVWGIIEEWVKWRRGILTSSYEKRLAAAKEALREAIAFMTVVNAKDKRMELVRIIADSGRDAGRTYIRDNFTRDEVPEDLIDFVSSRSLPSYHDGGKYAGIYQSGEAEIKGFEKALDNIDAVISKQMDELISRYGSQMERRTEVTNKDFEFSEDEDSVTVVKAEKFIDNTVCYYELKNNFLRKTRYPSLDSEAQYVVEGTASSTLIALDNRGRLLRIYCDDIALTGSDLGTYLPVYFGLDETDDYRITYLGVLDGGELTLIYKDGYVGHIDTSEWIGNNRNVRVLEKGIHPESAPYLGLVLKDEPQVMMVLDSEGRIGVQYIGGLKHKHRTARTRAFTLVKDTPLVSYLALDLNRTVAILQNHERYVGKLKFLEGENSFRATDETFVEFM